MLYRLAYVTLLSTAARMADWNVAPASEVVRRYRHLLWALEQPSIAAGTQDDARVSEWATFADRRIKEMEGSPKFNACVAAALRDFDARIREEAARRFVARSPHAAAGMGAAATAKASGGSSADGLAAKASIPAMAPASGLSRTRSLGVGKDKVGVLPPTIPSAVEVASYSAGSSGGTGVASGVTPSSGDPSRVIPTPATASGSKSSLRIGVGTVVGAGTGLLPRT